ncbi:hypothetical protein [Parasitella parasitica]|uniref:18S rRNA factor 2 n=1 Tax=Parasitella parasitica TaxID=35722 RepID=A0A0B7N4M2_9FUNG|nr:hypothetical protein [Parasitella parasitica]
MSAKDKKQDLFGLENDSGEENVSGDEQEQEDSRFTASRLHKQSLDSDDSDDDSDQDDDDDKKADEKADEKEAEKTDKPQVKRGTKLPILDELSSSSSEEDLENQEGYDAPATSSTKKKTKSKKLKKLSPEELKKFEDARNRTGVCYLSRIPPFMRPKKVRSLLAKHADIGRIFLVPEDPKITARRKKYTKSKSTCFVEGWVEFKDKKRARALAEYLNTRQMGGKRTSPYYDELWSIKYLPRFKWHNLAEHMAHERQARKQRLRAEIAQSTRENKNYIQNVERAKMLQNMEQKKRKRQPEAEKQQQQPQKIQRTFAQRSKVNRQVDPLKSGKQAFEKIDANVKNIIGNIFSKK